jgi:hypothetical protein
LIKVPLENTQFLLFEWSAEIAFLATSSFAMGQGAGEVFVQQVFGYEDALMFKNHGIRLRQSSGRNLGSKRFVDFKIHTYLSIDGPSVIDSQQSTG